ncbi:hypothetical protein Mp_1g09750 [Marchantia polymorpha subsp. ruderalis]|uniref:Uncharacterized protein n=2 Tax=Marchantia polymorpha TaxID=3197 RepID=A0AAF6AND6_MARPO|nr:hypothetical protein MARPO_0096s0026 [Marchantia polymorpha]BBM97956.1 hypothetical protein Mp_1g09750 [Marchantia polymorpha subsp. ruderalis]|eukprot:PTQ32674.1 hypothetical protein MARPO_0096s0026 [Marchantia polymorpha]
MEELFQTRVRVIASRECTASLSFASHLRAGSQFCPEDLMEFGTFFHVRLLLGEGSRNRNQNHKLGPWGTTSVSHHTNFFSLGVTARCLVPRTTDEIQIGQWRPEDIPLLRSHVRSSSRSGHLVGSSGSI